MNLFTFFWKKNLLVRLLSISFIITGLLGFFPVSVFAGGPDLIPPVFVSAVADGTGVTLSYDEGLDDASVPSTGDFVFNQDSTPIAVTMVSVVGSTVELTIATAVTEGATFDISYTPGADPIQDTAGNDVDPLVAQAVTGYACGLIEVGNLPIRSTLAGTNLYVLNDLDDSVSVINTLTHRTSATIAVGDSPTHSVLVGTDLYVLNNVGATVSVIDTSSTSPDYNTITDTIIVGTTPRDPILVGTDIYVMNGGDSTVSVINTATNLVTDTIVVGNGPMSPLLVGTDLYVINNDDSTISVIDTASNLVTDTVVVGPNSRSSLLVGTDLYVTSYTDGTISVIDAVSNLVTETILSVGIKPSTMLLVGTDLYVFNDSTISVIDTTSNLVADNFAGGDGVPNPIRVGTDIYFGGSSGSVVSVLDTTDNSISTISVGTGPVNPTLVGSELYFNDYGTNTVSVIDTTTNDVFVCVTTYDCEYTAGANGTLTGDTSQTVDSGEDATAVTAVPNSGYEFSSWSDASTANPRTDTNVTSDISVTANFVAVPVSQRVTLSTGSYVKSTLVKQVVNSSQTTSSNIPFSTTRTLRVTTNGDDVKALQTYLNKNGFPVSDTGPGSLGFETMKFGPKTKAAVIKFQLAHNLVADGVVGPKTKAEMK